VWSGVIVVWRWCNEARQCHCSVVRCDRGMTMM